MSSGRGEGIRRTHATYFLDFAERTWTEELAGKAHALALFDQERDNLSSAMRWALDARSDMALPMAAALWRYWVVRGDRRQGLEWLAQALGLPRTGAVRPRAVALAGAALLARLLGDFTRAEAWAREGISMGRAVGLPQAITVSLNVLTTLAARAGDFERADRHCRESMAVARDAGDPRLEAMALFILAEGFLHARRYAEVREVGGRALVLARAAGDPEVIAIVLARLGIAAAHDRRPAEAADHLVEAMRHARDLGFPDTAAWCCEGLALIAAGRGDFLRAARLLGAGESLRRSGGSVVQPAEAMARAATLTALRHAIPEKDLQVAIEGGRGLGLDAATTEALAVVREV